MSTNGHNHRQALPILPAPTSAPSSPVVPAVPPPPLLPVDWALPREEPLAEVERQMERGSQFTQAALDKLVGRLAGAEAYITELVDLLRARGILSDDDLADEDSPEAGPSREVDALASWEEPSEDAGAGSPATVAATVAIDENGREPAAAVASEHGWEPALEAAVAADTVEVEKPEAGTPEAETPEAETPEAETPEAGAPPSGGHGDAELSESGTQAKVSWPGIAFRVDPDDPAPPVAVNCDERMHVCHAVCCKLNFALTPEEVDAGTVKWDLGFPYMIRHGANGYCSHNDTSTGRCTNYANRPGVCHRYSCAHDPRIWKDFDAMILNEDWIRANLTHQSRITVGKALPLMEVKHGTDASRGPAEA